MGNGYRCRCEKCNYRLTTILGVGFKYPKVYQETEKAMRSGEFGDQGKRFFEDNPLGAVTCHSIAIRCKECGEYETVPQLTMYVPGKRYADIIEYRKNKTGWSGAFPTPGIEYVSPHEFEEFYTEYAKYHHTCAVCGGEAVEIDDFEKCLLENQLPCPRCEGKLVLQDEILWD